jgi:thiol-disulfide isomerase/thioredoxin
MLTKKSIVNLNLPKLFRKSIQLISITVLVQFSFSGQAQTIKTIDYKEFEQIISKPSDRIRVYNFWASWCRPCIMELPHFKEAQEKLKDKPVDFYFVTLDVPDKLEKAKEILKVRGFEGDHFLLNEPTNYWIDLLDPNWAGDIPYTVLIKSDGGKIPASFVFNSTKQLVTFVEKHL